MIFLISYLILAAIYFVVLIATRKNNEEYIPSPRDLTHEEDKMSIVSCVLICLFWLPAILGALLVGLSAKIERLVRK